MKATAKIGLVGAGYIGALLVATLAVAVYIARTDGPDRQTYAAMYDFGDSLLFLAVFGVAALVPTGVALYLLRPYRRFWFALSSVALVTAATGLASAVVYAIGRTTAGTSPFGVWAGLATFRILVAPICALGFAVSGLLAPTRAPRMALLAATLIDAAAFAYVVLTWTRVA